MRKGRNLFLLMVLILALIATGCCSVKTYRSEKPRSDIEVSGNQGVIYGPAPAPHKVANPNREWYAVDIELPTKDELMKKEKKEK